MMEIATLRELRAAGPAPRLLDVRTAAEFETAHIPGAYSVPLDILREHREELFGHLSPCDGENPQFVLVCRSGQRASVAERALAEAGLTNLRVLEGGMVAWEAAGGEVTRGRQTWELERQVRLVAGGIVFASILGSVGVPWLKWVAGAIGAGLVGAAVTNSCMMGAALAKLPFNRGKQSDISTVISQFAAR
jgi:rhodanese-related sulfurtransferase